MSKAITLCLVIVGLINFAPVLGVLSAQRLESAYSVSMAGADMEILMRHRALLFGILGAFILFAAFVPAYQTVAMIMAGVSMVGFALLAVSTGGYNESMGRVLMADLAGIVFLLAAAFMKYIMRTG